MADYLKEFAKADANIEKAQKTLEKSKTGDKPEKKTSTDDAYTKRPSQQNYRTQNKRGGDREEGADDGYRGKPRGRGGDRDRNYSSRGGYDGEQRTYNRGRGDRPPRGNNSYRNREEGGEAGAADGGEYRTTYRGRGGQDRGGRGRGGDRGGRGGDRGYSRGGRGGERGNWTRGGERNYSRRNEDVQSASEDEDALTADQQVFISNKKKEYGPKLKGLVDRDAIGRRCIDLEFDEDKLAAWVATLTTVDKRVENLADFNWNSTQTRADKADVRKKAAAEKKEKRIADAVRKKREAEAEARRVAKEAKEVERKARRAEKRKQKKAEGEEGGKTEAAEGAGEGDAESDEEQAAEHQAKGGKKGMVYRAKTTVEKPSEPVADTKDEQAASEKAQEGEEGDAVGDEEEKYEEGYYDEEAEYYEEEYYDQEEEDPAIVADDKDQNDPAKDSEKADSELLKEAQEVAKQQNDAEERAARDKAETDRKKKVQEEKERFERELQEKEAEKERLAKQAAAKNKKQSPEKASKKSTETKDKSEESAPNNPLTSMMNAQAGMLGMPQAPVLSAERLAKQQMQMAEGKIDPATMQQSLQQTMMDTYQLMLYYQQMAQYYQGMLAQQMAIQQQQMVSQNGGMDNTANNTMWAHMASLGGPNLMMAQMMGQSQGSADQPFGMMPPFGMYGAGQGMPNAGGFMGGFPNFQNQGQSKPHGDDQ